MTRQEAIDVLINSRIFLKDEINTKAANFYIKYLMADRDICDIDGMAWLNVLFGYDIGEANADAINKTLWESPEYLDEYGCGIFLIELKSSDKEMIKKICDDLHLEVSFDNWADPEKFTNSMGILE